MLSSDAKLYHTLELPPIFRSGGAQDRSAFFGHSVGMARAGFPVVVGTRSNAAFVYDRSPTLSEAAAGDLWSSVSLLVAPEDDCDGAPNSLHLSLSLSLCITVFHSSHSSSPLPPRTLLE
jgi:hypothetical protein